MEEIECSIYIELCAKTLPNVQNALFKICPFDQMICMEKIVDLKNGRRLITGVDGMQYEHKELSYKKHSLVKVHGCYVQVLSKRSIERFLTFDEIENFNRDILDKQFVSKISRQFFLLDGFRVALDFNQKHGFYALHIELENCSMPDVFANKLETVINLSPVVRAAFWCDFSFLDGLPAGVLKHKRKFVYSALVEKCKIFAPKIDGVKYGCILSKDRLIVIELNREFVFRDRRITLFQNFVGAIEHTPNGGFFLIDVVAVINSKKVLVELDGVEGARCIQSLPHIYGVKKNHFVPSERVAKEIVNVSKLKNVYDGVLGIYRYKILKMKFVNTVDILFTRPKKKIIINKTNIDKFLFLYNSEAMGLISLKKCGYTFDIGGDYSVFLNEESFFVLECFLVENKKTLTYYKKRQDKFVPNSLKTINDLTQ